MKKILSLALAVIMMLSMFSCAKDSISNENIISNHSAQNLVAEETYSSTATSYATEGTYVRGGTYANTVPDALPQQDYYFIKYDVIANTFRTPILRFDISDFTLPQNTKSISLVVDFYSISPVHENFAGQDLKVNVYMTDNNWDVETVTYASLPALSDEDIVGSEYIIKGEVYIDITDYIMECINNGVYNFSLRLAATVQSKSEMRIHTFDTIKGQRLVAKETESRVFYQPKILENETANQELWDYAKNIYSSWKSRYDEIVAKGDYESTEIISDPDSYTLQTTAKMQDQSEREYTFDTRLISTLNGFSS